MAFDQATRNRLQKFVSEGRKLLSEEFTQQLQNTYGLDPITGTIAALIDLPSLSPSEQQTAKLLRDTLEHYLAASHKADPHADKAIVTAALDRIVREQAFTVLNRLAALRMAEARQFVRESISQGHQSQGFRLYKDIAGSALGEMGQAYQVYLFSVFDELSLDLAVLFDRYSSQGRLFPRETVLMELLDLINNVELELLWSEDETIGWIYQYFNSKEERKKMRDESQAPRNSRELAVRNQFFTPRYVVEFLTDNTLGRIWYEMTKGQTSLVDSCQYLVRRPNEVFLETGQQVPEVISPDNSKELSQEELMQQTVYIQHRPLKDPRDIKMLDPACGSMHFGLYAFDLFEKIYSEAWDIEKSNAPGIFVREKIDDEDRQALHQDYDSKEAFLADVPRLIIERNIHGVDIDTRATQIAGLSLWLRAQKSWTNNDIQPNKRPKIQRSNIVCAEPMPGEKHLLKEFTSQIQPRVLGQLVEEIFDKMQLAGEAGTLLKIEEEIQSAIEEAKSQKDENILEVQGGLFEENKWEVREGKRYYNFGDVDDDFWNQAEHSILTELERYAESAIGFGSSQKRLFAADAAKGFAFIDLCRKRFDVVLQNPPFGDASNKSKKYTDKEYKSTKNDICGSFVIRGMELLNQGGLFGAITTRLLLFIQSFNGLRNEVSDRGAFNLVSDFGYGVLDAMVETACYTISKNESLQINEVGFIGLLNEVDKEVSFGETIKNQEIIWKKAELFKQVEGAPLVYWVPDSFLARYTENCSFQLIGGSTNPGTQTSDDFQFYRLAWEMGVVDFVHSDESDGDWTLVTKGGEYSPWWDDVHLMLDWADNGYRVKNFVDGKGKLRSVLRSLPKMYEACATYPYRTTSGFGMRYMPKGGSFSVGGWGVFSPENYNIFEVLAVYNTRYARTFMEILLGQGDSSVSGSAARNHVADAVGGIPFPKIKLPISVSANVQRIIELWMELHESETSFHYEAPLKFDPAGMSYENICNLAWSHRASLLKLVSGLYNNIEAAVEDSYEFDSNELAYIDEAEGQSLYSYPRSTVNKDALLAFVNMNIQDLTSFSKNKLGPARYIVKKSYFIDRHLDLFCHVYGCHIADVLDAYESISPLQTNFSADLAHKILNWIVGCLLGRWDINVLKNRLNAPIGLSGFESLLSNYESIYKERSGKEFLVHSSIKSTLVDEISECAEKVFGVKYDAIIKSMLDQVGAVSIEEYFCDPKRFFAWHLSVHSKSRRQAPVVLPLSSNQGKIIVFIHYKNLSIDLMYQVINEVIEPLISNCEEDLKTLNITEDRDKHEESLQFMEDAYDFRDCIKKLCNNWEFYPQDGAVIALSPLKNMFKNTQWVGRLTKIEIDLNAGKYDWAMLSTHYWPERVYKKCHQDRSIAIAHDVEAELWEEVEVPAARGSGTKWVWKPKEMTEAELDAYIQLKISKDKSLS